MSEARYAAGVCEASGVFGSSRELKLFLEWLRTAVCSTTVKVKGSPYSITERRVPGLIAVLGSQPAGDVSHKPGGIGCRYFRQAYSYPRNP